LFIYILMVKSYLEEQIVFYYIWYTIILIIQYNSVDLVRLEIIWTIFNQLNIKW